MKTLDKRHILVFLLIFLLSLYSVAVYQNYRSAQEYNKWRDFTINAQYEQLSQQRSRENELFILQRTNEETAYIEDLMIAEMECVESVSMLLVPVLQAVPAVRAKIAYTTQFMSALGYAFIEYKSTIMQYRTTFENEHRMTSDDWDNKSWRDFLGSLGEELPESSEVKEEYYMDRETLQTTVIVDTHLDSLQWFYERTVARYITHMDTGETDKALFDLLLLRSMRRIFTQEDNLLPSSLHDDYLYLIKENLLCAVPLSVWLWAVYLGTVLAIYQTKHTGE